MHGCTLKHSQLLENVQDHAMLIFLAQFRTNVSFFESVIRLVPAKLYDKCIENCGLIPSLSRLFIHMTTSFSRTT